MLASHRKHEDEHDHHHDDKANGSDVGDQFFLVHLILALSEIAALVRAITIPEFWYHLVASDTMLVREDLLFGKARVFLFR